MVGYGLYHMRLFQPLFVLLETSCFISLVNVYVFLNRCPMLLTMDAEEYRRAAEPLGEVVLMESLMCVITILHATGWLIMTGMDVSTTASTQLSFHAVMKPVIVRTPKFLMVFFLISVAHRLPNFITHH